MELDLDAAEALLVAELDRRARLDAWAETQRLFAAGERLESFRVFCEGNIVITTKVPGETLPFRWTEIQRRFNACRFGVDIVLKARQIGLTTNELARDLWFALTRPSAAVAVVVQPHKEAEPKKKLCAQLAYMIEHLGVDVGAHWSGGRVTFDNESFITVLDSGGTEKTADKQGRGGTFHRVHLTESAFYPFADAVVGALLNALASPEQGGELVDESTPNGAHGRFYRQVQGARAGTTGQRLHFFPWVLQREYRTGPDDGPARPQTPDDEHLALCALEVGVTLSQAQLRWWRQQVATKGRDRTIQEYPHDPARCFLLPGSSYFDVEAVERLEKRVTDPLGVEELPEALAALAADVNDDEIALRVWEAPVAGEEYLVVVDTAGGKKRGDWPAALVLARSTWRHVATYRQKVPPSEFARRVARLGRAFGEVFDDGSTRPAEIAVERNNHGAAVLVVLSEQEHYPRLWSDEKGELGWWTGPHNRLVIIDELVDAVTQGAVDTRDPVFSAEARTFVRFDDGSVGAARGEHDDVVMAMAIGRRILSLSAPVELDVGRAPRRR